MTPITQAIQQSVFLEPQEAETQRLKGKHTLKQVSAAVTALFPATVDQKTDSKTQVKQMQALKSLKVCIKARKEQKGVYTGLVRLLKKIFGIQDSLSIAQDNYKTHKATFLKPENNLVETSTQDEKDVSDYKNELNKKQKIKEDIKESLDKVAGYLKIQGKEKSAFYERHAPALKQAIYNPGTGSTSNNPDKGCPSDLKPLHKDSFRTYTLSSKSQKQECIVIKCKGVKAIGQGALKKAKFGISVTVNPDKNIQLEPKIILISKVYGTSKSAINRQLDIQNCIRKSEDDRLGKCTLLPNAASIYTGSSDTRQQDKIAFIQEYSSIGNMYKIVKYDSNGKIHSDFQSSDHREFTPQQRWDMILQVINLVVAFHDNGIYLRDIKPENLLIFEDTNGALTIKCNDFDTSYHAKLFSDAFDSKARGTPEYYPPSYNHHMKKLERNKQTDATQSELETHIKRQDIWSLACVLYNLCCQRDVSWSGKMRNDPDYFLLADKSGIDEKKLQAALEQLFSKEQRESNPLCKLIYGMLSDSAFSLDQLKEGAISLNKDEAQQRFLADFSNH